MVNTILTKREIMKKKGVCFEGWAKVKELTAFENDTAEIKMEPGRPFFVWFRYYSKCVPARYTIVDGMWMNGGSGWR